MLKSFAVSKREQFLVTGLIISQKSKDQEERRKRLQLWSELGINHLRRAMLKVWTPAEQQAEADKQKSDPTYVNPNAAFVWQYADDEPNIRVEISDSTIRYLLDKLTGEMEGPTGEVLGELHDRLQALRDTSASAVCTKTGAGYRLPLALWTAAEIEAAEPHPVAVPAAE